MRKFLLVGDMHVRKDNLEESSRVIDFVIETAKYEEANAIVFMGDQFDTHGVAHLEVVEFWRNSLSKIRQFTKTVMLHGNHDMDGAQTMSWNYIFGLVPNDGVVSIEQPTEIWKERGNTLVAMSYVKSSEQFCDTISILKANLKDRLTVLCHQEFKNASYGNGFYAPHGVDLSDPRIQGVEFISGHIHQSQTLWSKDQETSVIYVGTPRPVSITETDDKYLTLLSVDDTVDTRQISVPETVAEPFRTVVVREGEQFTVPSELKSRTIFEFHGTKDFVKSSANSLPKGSKVRTFTVQQKQNSSYKESEGVSAALVRYINETCTKKGVSVDKLMQVVDQVCPEVKGF